MFTVALIGPDGAGKTSLCRRLERTLPMRARYLYMGVNQETGNALLPTTRLWLRFKRGRSRRPDLPGSSAAAGVNHLPATRMARFKASLRECLRIANLIGEETYRTLLARIYMRDGTVVLLDRDFYADYHAADLAGQPRTLARRLHGEFLRRSYRRPDLVVYLDAPAEVLLERKGEGTIESLERRRTDYRKLADELPFFVSIDAARPFSEVAKEVTELIGRFHTAHTGAQWGAGTPLGAVHSVGLR